MILSEISFAGLFTWFFIGLLCIALVLNFINLPGNWIIIALISLWDWLNPFSEHAGLLFWLGITGLGIAGEFLENYLQILKSRKAGATKKGMWAAFITSLVCSFLLAPLFFGLGAIIGALLGAWLGCLGMELFAGRPFNVANKAALGALSGRMLGAIGKLGLGAAIIYLAMRAFLPVS